MVVHIFQNGTKFNPPRKAYKLYYFNFIPLLLHLSHAGEQRFYSVYFVMWSHDKKARRRTGLMWLLWGGAYFHLTLQGTHTTYPVQIVPIYHAENAQHGW